MNLPSEFISTITNTFGEDGEYLIANLPVLIDEASQRWGLTDVQPVANLSYNFVAFANRSSTTGFATNAQPSAQSGVVLKIGVPRDELISEIAALKLFNGEGACRLIDSDEERGFLLLERLDPGTMLSTLEDDEEATHIAAEVMQKIWRSPALASGASVDYGATNTPLRSARAKFILLSDWFDGLKRLREMFDGGTGPLDETLVDRVEHSVKDFFAENHMPVLMHGDFHHFNILSSERGWLVIDPKGVVGPAGYEVGPFMMNPWDSHFDRLSASLSDGIDQRLRIQRRIDILHEHLGWERERILDWSLAHAVLSTWWGIEDNTGWEYSLQVAELLAGIK